VRQIAAGLAELGVGRGDTVALMMTNRPEFHLVDTATFHLGAAPFSVDNTLAAEQVRHVLANADSRVVVCEQEFAPRLPAVRPGTAVQRVVCVDGRLDGTITLAALEASRDPGPGFEARWRAVNPGDLLTLVYTSGTTGPPKGVEITHAQMLAGLTATSSILSAGPGDRAVSYLPMAHIAERYAGHYGAMFAGVQVTPLADAKALPGALQDIRPTIFAGVPRVWEKFKAATEAMVAYEPDQARRRAMHQAMRTAREHVRAAQAGAVPARMADAYRRADQQVLSKIRFALGLDQVRTAICGAAPVAPEVLEFMHALGIAVPGVELKLADDGELLVRGPTLMNGYRHDPARTTEALGPGGWLRTGDG